VFPTLRLKRLGTLRGEERDGWPVAAGLEDAADSCDWNSCDLPWNVRFGRRREEQFVVVSAMKGVVKARAGMDGQQRWVDFGGYAGLLAEMGQIGGEPVAEVDGGGCESALAKKESLCDARLRREMTR